MWMTYSISVQGSRDVLVKKLYNECADSLIHFRTFHIQLVTRLVQFVFMWSLVTRGVTEDTNCQLLSNTFDFSRIVENYMLWLQFVRFGEVFSFLEACTDSCLFRKLTMQSLRLWPVTFMTRPQVNTVNVCLFSCNEAMEKRELPKMEASKYCGNNTKRLNAIQNLMVNFVET